MSTNDSNSISDETSSSLLAPVSRSIPFGIYITLIIPSIPCYLFIFIQYIRKQMLRKHIRSHIILAVLVCSFLQVTTELPVVLSYLHNNLVPIQSDFFCKLWACQDYSFNVMILMLMCYTAIERYLIVYHRIFFNQHLIILHYIPMVVCIIYPIILYIYFIFLYPCTNQFTYTMITCGGPCYFYETAISIFDQFIDLVLPVLLSSYVTLALLIRVLRQKYHMQQRQMWRRNRRLVIQLLYIIILYNLLWLPMVICSSIMLFSTVPQPILIDLSINILPYGIYVVILLCPFVSLMSLPELWPRSVRGILRFRRTINSVRPQIQIPMVHTHITSRTVVIAQQKNR